MYKNNSLNLNVMKTYKKLEMRELQSHLLPILIVAILLVIFTNYKIIVLIVVSIIFLIYIPYFFYKKKLGDMIIKENIESCRDLIGKKCKTVLIEKYGTYYIKYFNCDHKRYGIYLGLNKKSLMMKKKHY